MEDNDTYTPRRKVIVEKFSIFERSKIVSFLREKKFECARKQKYEEAARWRSVETCMDLDYNIVEEYIFLIRIGRIVFD